jgi:hypothetical protein
LEVQKPFLEKVFGRRRHYSAVDLGSNYSALEKIIMPFMSPSPVRCPSATSLRLIRS